MSELAGDWNWLSIQEQIMDGRPICYGVLKPGVYDDQGVPLIRIVDIEGDQLDTSQLYRITNALDQEFSRSRVRGGDLLLSIQGTIGRVAIVPGHCEGANISRTLARLSFANKFDAPFYRYWALSPIGQKAIDFATVGTTRSSLNLSVLRTVKVPNPVNAEKGKITEILDILDRQIRRTEALIAKLELTKQGLLSDLLTRGVGADGNLRPPADQAPELYKDSTLGKIPKEWKAVKVGQIALVKGGKRLPAGHDYSSDKTSFRYLRVTDFFEKSYALNDLECLSERTFNALKRYEIFQGDLYISIAGSIGHVGVHRIDGFASYRTILTENAARIVLQEESNPDFVALYMNSSLVQKQVESEKGTGGGVPKLALFRIEQLDLAMPDESEQARVVAAHRSLLDRVHAERTNLKKLQKQKSGLMDDLLTGRVRVTPLLDGAAGQAAQ